MSNHHEEGIYIPLYIFHILLAIFLLLKSTRVQSSQVSYEEESSESSGLEGLLSSEDSDSSSD